MSPNSSIPIDWLFIFEGRCCNFNSFNFLPRVKKRNGHNIVQLCQIYYKILSKMADLIDQLKVKLIKLRISERLFIYFNTMEFNRKNVQGLPDI